MAVSNDLVKPETEEDFEAMCHQLYKRLWNDTGCMRVGRSGQKQFGVDILGHDGRHSVGIQCKHYNKTPFTLATVTSDVAEADASGLQIGHLLFATTAASKSTLVREVHELSEKRRASSQFTVSVDFWGDISGHIRMHPEVGRAFVPDFPGGAMVSILESTSVALELLKEGDSSRELYQATSIALLRETRDALSAIGKQTSSPDARGDEADPRVTAALDFIRDRLREGKTNEADALLKNLGDPQQFRDSYSRFRWYTNRAAVDLQEGRNEEAANGYLKAFEYAPDDGKAHANRAHAYLLLNDGAAALTACDEGIIRFSDSTYLWSLRLHARHNLGDDNPERDLPHALEGTADLLFSRARLRGKKGDYPTAIELLGKCLVADGGSFDAKRSFLAEALSWAALQPVLTHHHQLTNEQRKALADAVENFEPLEQTISAIQSDRTSHEITNNITVALMFLGQKERARPLAGIFLYRHPLSEGLLRLRLNHLEETDDIDGIHALTDFRLAEFPPPVLAILSEISANQGDIAWHSKVMRVLEDAGIEADKLRELRALTFHAQWVAGNKQTALTAAQDYVQRNPQHVFPRVMVSHMLFKLGKRDEAIAEAAECVAQLGPKGAVFDSLHVADLLFQLRQFRDSAALYAELVVTLGDDEFTWKLLLCLVESDQRRKAQAVFERLSPAVRQLSKMRRIEANLARRMGDWSRLRELMESELLSHPDAVDLAVAYVGALYRLGATDTLTDYLKLDPKFKDASLEDEFEFAKYQSNCGLVELAIARLYRLYRANSGSTRVAGYYLGQVLMAPKLAQLDLPDVAGPGTAAQLRSPAETWWVAIEGESIKPCSSWPELVGPETELALRLNGRKLGERVNILRGFSEQEVEVVGLCSTYSFAARKAHELIGSSAVPEGPIWSVRIIKDDGNPDIDMLLRSAQERREHVETAFATYKQHRFPVSTLAHMIGSDPVTLLMEWPSNLASLFVGIGTHEERGAASKVIQRGGRRYVLDLFTIAEIVRHAAFDAIVGLLGRPFVPQTAREQLLVLLQLIQAPKESSSLREQEGKLRLVEIPSAHYGQREKLLRAMLKAIDDQCDVVPTAGPELVTPNHRFLAKILDKSTLDAMYLCLEHNAILLSEDGALRLLAPEAGISFAIGVQPILMEASVVGLYGNVEYSNAMALKLSAGHDFVSVRSEDLMLVAKRTPNQPANSVRIAFETFRHSTLDIISGVRVTNEFLVQAAKILPINTVATYANIALESLQYGRPELADVIHQSLSMALQAVYGRGGRGLPKKSRRLFGRLLCRMTAKVQGAHSGEQLYDATPDLNKRLPLV